MNRDDYPGLTDEQWEKLEAEFKAEGDRRATQASQTAKRGLVSQAEVQAQIDAALAAERERAEMDAAQRLDADRKAFEAQQQEFAAQQRTFKAKAKLSEAGLPEDKIESLLPLFASVEDTTLDTTLDAFITTHTESVKAKVDAEKVALLGGAKPPAGQTAAPTDVSTAVTGFIEQGNDAAAAELLLQEAGVIPAPTQ